MRSTRCGVTLGGAAQTGSVDQRICAESYELERIHSGGVDPRGADSRGVDPRGADSRGVDPRGVDSRGADSRGVDLRGVDSRGVDLRGMDSRGADSRGVNSRSGFQRGGFMDSRGANSGRGEFGKWRVRERHTYTGQTGRGRRVAPDPRGADSHEADQGGSAGR